MIIPKPAGPRRFLTAFAHRCNETVVDPFFMPIATSPITTGQNIFLNLNSPIPVLPVPNLQQPPPDRLVQIQTGLRNRLKNLLEPRYSPLPSPLNISDSMEYFSEAAAKLGASPSSGLVIQSPSGQPAGIFFHPKGKGKGSNTMERERGQFLVPAEPIRATTARRSSNNKEPKSPRSPHSPMTFLHCIRLLLLQNPVPSGHSFVRWQPAPAGSLKPKGKNPARQKRKTLRCQRLLGVRVVK